MSAMPDDTARTPQIGDRVQVTLTLSGTVNLVYHEHIHIDLDRSDLHGDENGEVWMDSTLGDDRITVLPGARP